MDNKIKILVCGDVKGKFKQLFHRVEIINQKSGPFEILLCVGEFFDKNNDELIAYKNGYKNVPVPTFILGSCLAETVKNFDISSGGDICSNITYLGKRGLYTLSNGIKIAYVSGVESDQSSDISFDESDINFVADICLASKGNLNDYRGIDILITSQWCRGIMENDNSSPLISYLITQIRPRYHFCGLNKLYYEAPPFRIKPDNNTQLELSTRFIALANVGNIKKEKYIYAASLVPVEKMRITDLLQKTTDEIPFPFSVVDFSKYRRQQKKNDDNTQYFYDLSKPGSKRESKGNKTPYKKARMEIDLEKCWFCLSSPNVEKHLIVSIGNNFYVAFPKGPLNDFHVLILSITHIQSSSLLTSSDWKELENFKKALKNFFKSKGLTTCFFERNYKTAHLQINAVGLEKHLDWKIKHSFEDKAEEYNISFETVPELTQAADLPQQGPYFVAELNECTLITKDMKRFPLHFAREAICSENLLNNDEKVDWRDCKLSTEEEISLVKQFRENFKPFDCSL
ncbi:CWF19-like protein 1 homolog [Condylostylus longicornis]|uniref:CWF19-like protein 1 homolog n=1 Tax=Condylostylus longicornis TaxID=2530218 RepID=UPI00244E2952|nr:CWF19-like protein 1 homolog [Condylostylus longicornis]